MNKIKINPGDGTFLRQKAEGRLRKRKLGIPITSGTEADALRLIHELEVHQIELEMQNEELMIAEEKAKTAIEKYTALYDFAPMGYFTIDSDCKITGLNLLGAKMLGKGRSQLLNISFRRFVTQETQNFFDDFFQNVFITKTQQICEVRLETKADTSIFVHIEGIVSEEDNNCLLTAIDITRRKRAEETLQENENRLRNLNATKDKFFSIIAHDLKSPFNSIIGFTNLLAEQIHKKDYSEVEEYAEIIQSSSWRAMDLLTNLLEWSRSQTGRIEFNPHDFEIAELINETTELLNDSARQKSITISVTLPHNVIAFGDKSMISTILRNLITNAVKFTNQRGKIDISASQTETESVVSVSDTGIGLKKEDVEKLFRIEESLSTKGTEGEMGTGLGLLLCKDFIKKHGGKIWVESEPGKGSRFVFTLPNRGELNGNAPLK